MSNNAPVAPSPPPDGNVGRAYTVAAPTIVTVVVATILTGLRLFVRLKLLRKLEWDDFFNVLAMVSCLWSVDLVLVETGLILDIAAGRTCGHGPRLRSDVERAWSTSLLCRACQGSIQYRASADMRILPYFIHRLPKNLHQPVLEKIIVSNIGDQVS